MKKTVDEKIQVVRMSEENHKKELGIIYSRTMKFSILTNKQDKFPGDTDLQILISKVIKEISSIKSKFSEFSNIFRNSFNGHKNII